MQLTLSARSVLASVSLVGLGMLAGPWRSAPQVPRNLDARLRALEAVLTPENGVKLMNMLPHMRVVEEPNLDGSTLTTIVFEHVNVQIVNGLGATNGFPTNPRSVNPSVAMVNGLGNLIVGYNEAPRPSDLLPLQRTGSHNIIVGSYHGHSSFGGLIVGQENTISGAYSSVSGGSNNTASGDYSSVSGGGGWLLLLGNQATGDYASISGGQQNVASGDNSSVSGGEQNVASAVRSSVSGGSLNSASGNVSSVSGGNRNTAGGVWSSVSGGQLNMASGNWSSVSGGANTASGLRSSVCGGQNNHANATYSSISGGMNNTVAPTGTHATVSGGVGVTVSTPGGHQ